LAKVNVGTEDVTALALVYNVARQLVTDVTIPGNERLHQFRLVEVKVVRHRHVREFPRVVVNREGGEVGVGGVRLENEFPITAVNIPHPSAVAIHTLVRGAVFVTTDGAPVSGFGFIDLNDEFGRLHPFVGAVTTAKLLGGVKFHTLVSEPSTAAVTGGVVAARGGGHLLNETGGHCKRWEVEVDLDERRLIFVIDPIGRTHLFFCEKKHDARCTRRTS
jgi:hypothetical protein